MAKFQVGDTVRVCKKNLLSYGKEFVVTEIWGTCIYHGNQWNDERELELVSRPTRRAPDFCYLLVKLGWLGTSAKAGNANR